MSELTYSEKDLIFLALANWKKSMNPEQWKNCYEESVLEIILKLQAIPHPIARHMGHS